MKIPALTQQKGPIFGHDPMTSRDGSLAFCGYGQSMLVAAEDGGLVKILVGVQCKSNVSYYLFKSIQATLNASQNYPWLCCACL